MKTFIFVSHGRRGAWRHLPQFGVAGVALAALVALLALGWVWWRAWSLLVARDSVVGLPLGDIHLRFTWQAWHMLTSTFVLRGTRATCGTGLVARLSDAAALCVAGVALGDIHLRFTWQAWRLGASNFCFAWQVWRLWRWAGSGGALMVAVSRP